MFVATGPGDEGEVAFEIEHLIFEKYNEAGAPGDLYAYGIECVWDLLDVGKVDFDAGKEIGMALLNGIISPRRMVDILRFPCGVVPIDAMRGAVDLSHLGAASNGK